MMKKTGTGVAPLLVCAIIGVFLRIIPQTRMWSPALWEADKMFGLSKGVVAVLLVAAAFWSGTRGTETIKRAGAVALPIMLAVLVWSAIAGFGVGISQRYMPLAATTAITGDFLAISGEIAWIFDTFKKVRKN